MVLERLTAATVAGIDQQIQLIKREQFRIIMREATEHDGLPCVKLTEIREGKSKLLCVAPAKMASLFLVGWMEELDIEKEA